MHTQACLCVYMCAHVCFVRHNKNEFLLFWNNLSNTQTFTDCTWTMLHMKEKVKEDCSFNVTSFTWVKIITAHGCTLALTGDSSVFSQGCWKSEMSLWIWSVLSFHSAFLSCWWHCAHRSFEKCMEATTSLIAYNINSPLVFLKHPKQPLTAAGAVIF